MRAAPAPACALVKLHIWKGGVSDAELHDRWQELAWRVNEGFHRETSLAGDEFLRFLDVLAERQRMSHPVTGEVTVPTRITDVAAIPLPSMAGRVRRFPRKMAR